jgi:sporulation protein YlmC with PRC-barrel domain
MSSAKAAKRTALEMVMALAVAALLSISPQPVRSADVALVVVDVVSVAKGYRVTELIGKSVLNDKNDKIGSLDDIIIAKEDRVLFAIIQVGGFLGIGSKLVAVPYKSLQISDDASKIMLPGASKDQLKNLPEFHYLRR